jgi:hypothetical protein
MVSLIVPLQGDSPAPQYGFIDDLVEGDLAALFAGGAVAGSAGGALLLATGISVEGRAISTEMAIALDSNRKTCHSAT